VLANCVRQPDGSYLLRPEGSGAIASALEPLAPDVLKTVMYDLMRFAHVLDTKGSKTASADIVSAVSTFVREHEERARTKAVTEIEKLHAGAQLFRRRNEAGFRAAPVSDVKSVRVGSFSIPVRC
jgi:hypothetical protein